jgi:CHASE2 domain-containing sensor protein
MTAIMLRDDPPATGTRRSSRRTLWWARIVCLSVFGPYVTGSARTEQIAVFASFAAILIVGWPRIVNARSIPVTPFLVVWLGLDAVMLIGAVRRDRSTPPSTGRSRYRTVSPRTCSQWR